ncbi:MAG: type II toxin-antitoxin system VapC family toxin [Acidimicrobiales bacterium]
MIVVDWAAVVDALTAVEGTRELCARLANEELCAPALLYFELVSALRGLTLGRHLSPTRAEDVLTDFDDLEIRRWPSGDELRRRAFQLRDDVSRSLDGACPMAVFEAVERPALIALPASPFELAAWSRPKVGADCHIRVGKALYSLPWRYIGALRRRPGQRLHRRGLRRRQGGQDLGSHRQRPPDRLGGLPAREGGVLHAHPDVVSTPSRGAGHHGGRRGG